MQQNFHFSFFFFSVKEITTTLFCYTELHSPRFFYVFFFLITALPFVLFIVCFGLTDKRLPSDSISPTKCSQVNMFQFLQPSHGQMSKEEVAWRCHLCLPKNIDVSVCKNSTSFPKKRRRGFHLVSDYFLFFIFYSYFLFFVKVILLRNNRICTFAFFIPICQFHFPYLRK